MIEMYFKGYKEQVMQEDHLVIYTHETDLIDEINRLRKGDKRSSWKPKDKKLVIQETTSNTIKQQCYYFRQYSGLPEHIIDSIQGIVVNSVRFLNGLYPNTLLNYCLSRCRGRAYMAEKI